MTCEELDTLVDDLAFGELDEAAERRVRGHAASCRRCADELDAAETLARRVRRLPVEQTPRRDLWPAIERRLSSPRPHQRLQPSWLLLAAASLVAFTTGVGLRWLPASSAPGSIPASPVATSSDTVGATVGWARIAFREDHFRRIRDDLLAAVEERRDRLPPETLQVVEQNLALLEAAVGNLRQALAERPDDPDLPRQIANAYHQQARVARQIERTILSL